MASLTLLLQLLPLLLLLFSHRVCYENLLSRGNALHRVFEDTKRDVLVAQAQLAELAAACSAGGAAGEVWGAGGWEGWEGWPLGDSWQS